MSYLEKHWRPVLWCITNLDVKINGVTVDVQAERIAWDSWASGSDTDGMRYIAIAGTNEYTAQDRARIIVGLNKEFKTDLDFINTIRTREDFRIWASKFLAW